MKVIEAQLEGVKILQPTIHRDGRGFFLETYHEDRYRDLGIDCHFVQSNHSYSRYGTLRGMHYQSSPGQAKLIRVAVGQIFDVVVDIRKNSPTFGQWEGIYLDSQSHQQLFIPVGFAHGFCVTSDEAHVLYNVSAVYDPTAECGFRWDDPDIGIEWPLNNPTLSERDQHCPLFSELFLD